MIVTDTGIQVIGSATSTSATCTAFTPTAGLGYLLCVPIFTSQAAQATTTPTWATGGTGCLPWVLLASFRAGIFFPSVEYWWSAAPPGSSPGSSTIKVQGNADVTGFLCAIREVTGADLLNPTGFNATANNAANTVTLTPKFTGSLGYFCDGDVGASYTPVANAASTLISFANGTGTTLTICKGNANMTAGTNQTLGITNTVSNSEILGIEIIPAGVQVTEDPNAPTATNSTTTTPGSISYTPPIDNMTVIVMVDLRTANNSTAPAATISDGTNTYTLIASANTTGSANGGGAFVYAHTYGAGTAGTALTITCTGTAGTISGGAMVARGVENANASTGIGVTKTLSSNTAAALSIASGADTAGSQIYGAAIRNGSATAPTAVAVTSLMAQALSTGSPVYSANAFKSTAVTTGSTVTYGYSTSTIGQVCYAEFKVVVISAVPGPSSLPGQAFSSVPPGGLTPPNFMRLPGFNSLGDKTATIEHDAVVAVAMSFSVSLVPQVEHDSTVAAAMQTAVALTTTVEHDAIATTTMATAVSLTPLVEHDAVVSAAMQTTVSVSPQVTYQAAINTAMQTAVALTTLVEHDAVVTVGLQTTVLVSPGGAQSATVAVALQTAVALTTIVEHDSTVAVAMATTVNVTSQRETDATVAVSLQTSVSLTPLVTHQAAITAAMATSVNVTPLVTYQAAIVAALQTAVNVTPQVTYQPAITAAMQTAVNVTISGNETATINVGMATSVLLTALVTHQAVALVAMATALAVVPQIEHDANVAVAMQTTIALAAQAEHDAAILVAMLTAINIVPGGTQRATFTVAMATAVFVIGQVSGLAREIICGTTVGYDRFATATTGFDRFGTTLGFDRFSTAIKAGD